MVEPAPAAFVFNYTRTFVLCQERDSAANSQGKTYKRLERLYPILAIMSSGAGCAPQGISQNCRCTVIASDRRERSNLLTWPNEIASSLRSSQWQAEYSESGLGVRWAPSRSLEGPQRGQKGLEFLAAIVAALQVVLL
jgi:hypothetical protein